MKVYYELVEAKYATFPCLVVRAVEGNKDRVVFQALRFCNRQMLDTKLGPWYTFTIAAEPADTLFERAERHVLGI